MHSGRAQIAAMLMAVEGNCRRSMLAGEHVVLRTLSVQRGSRMEGRVEWSPLAGSNLLDAGDWCGDDIGATHLIQQSAIN